MMHIRSVTIGINWEDKAQDGLAKVITDFMHESRLTYEAAGFLIRTYRLSLPPLNGYSRFSRASAHSILEWISDLCEDVGIRWFCVPFSAFEPDELKERYAIALQVAKRYKNAFINLIAAHNGAISKPGIEEGARLIRAISRLSNNGFDNFRVGVSCNCQPNTPFFPFSFHEGEDGFSLALETVNLFIDVILRKRKEGLDVVQHEILRQLVEQLKRIDALGGELSKKTRMKYFGVDASLAPFPDGSSSVARIVELLGVEDFGSYGSLFFTSFLTNIIKTALRDSAVAHVGFNGVMYSLLEDDYLARRNNQKNLSIDALMLYSAVCGCGLDMVPVPGDILEEEISSLILDVAGMAITLQKPLGVRLLPIPMKRANDLTGFNYDFLVDTRVLNVINRASTQKLFLHDRFDYLK